MKPDAEADEIRRLLEDIPDIRLDSISRAAPRSRSRLKARPCSAGQCRGPRQDTREVSDVFMYHEDMNNRLPDNAKELVRDSSRGSGDRSRSLRSPSRRRGWCRSGL